MTQRKSPRDLRAGLDGVYTSKTTDRPSGLAEAPAVMNEEDAARQGGAPALYVARQKQGLLEEVSTLRAANEVLRRQGAVPLAADDIDDFWPSDRLPEAFADEAYLTLVESIERHGQDQPIIVRPHPDQADRYQIACGRRRREACRSLRQPVMAIIHELDDDQLLHVMLRENEEREDLSLYERAAFIRAMQTQTGLSVRALAKRLQISAGYVSRLARLPKLDDQLRQLIGDPRTLSMRTLEALGDTFGGDDKAAQTRLERAIQGWGDIKPASEPEARAKQLIRLATQQEPPAKITRRELRSIENRVLGHLHVDAQGRPHIVFAATIDRGELEQIVQAIETLKLAEIESV